MCLRDNVRYSLSCTNGLQYTLHCIQPRGSSALRVERFAKERFPFLPRGLLFLSAASVLPGMGSCSCSMLFYWRYNSKYTEKRKGFSYRIELCRMHCYGNRDSVTGFTSW